MANPIKDKFIEHMQFFGLTQETQKGYISAVRSVVKGRWSMSGRLVDQPMMIRPDPG